MGEDEIDLEWHVPGMRFWGPGTRLDLRLKKDGKTPKIGCEPVDRVDEAALRHDIFYTEHSSQRERVEIADKQMIDELKSIENPTCRERLERAIVIQILKVKQNITLTFILLFDWLCSKFTTRG